jgi:lipopolysaccharide transport system permease protein
MYVMTGRSFTTLPPTQLVHIRPQGSLSGPSLSELWAYRELLYFLTWRDVKIRYKQTFIGVAWALLQPVVTTAIFTIIFSSWGRFETGTVPYPVFVLSGLLIWLFTHSSVTMSSNSFVSNVNLVTKVYFPRLIVPIAATLAGVLDMVISAVLLLLLMAYYGVGISMSALLAPIFLVVGFIQAAAVGTLLSALNVRFRDVKFALPFLLQVWMIASPVFYPVEVLGEKWRAVFAINPLVGTIEGLRSALFGRPFEMSILAVSLASTVVLCLISIIVFNRMEDDFADVI